MRRDNSHEIKSVKYFTLHLGIKHFTLGRLNFTVNQILHPNKHDKMCKIFSGNFFFFEPNKMIKSTLDIYYETIL